MTEFDNAIFEIEEVERFFTERNIEESKTQRSNVGNSKITAFFDKNDKKIKEVTLSDTTFETYYDIEGSITHTISRNEEGAITYAEAFYKDGKKISRQNEKGKVYPEAGSHVGVKFDHNGKIIFEEYNKNSQKVKETDSYGYISIYNEQEKIEKIYNYKRELDYTSEYSINGNEVKRTFYNSDGSIYNYSAYEYDTNGNKIKVSNYNSDDTIKYYYTSEYDINGNEIKRTGYDTDGKVSHYYIYEYDTCGNEIKETNYNSNGAIKSYFKYEYDNLGNKIKSTGYNSDGSINYKSAWKRDVDGVWSWTEYALNKE